MLNLQVFPSLNYSQTQSYNGIETNNYLLRFQFISLIYNIFDISFSSNYNFRYLFTHFNFTQYIIYKKIRTLNIKLPKYDSRSLDRLYPCILLILYWLQQILKKYKKSKRYSELQELHIQCVVDELKGYNKEENFHKFFEVLQSSLSTIGSFKFLVLCHKLIYQLQQEFAIRFIQNKLIPGDDTDKSRLAIYYYNFLFKLCENFDYYKEVIENL
ncbi:unnamed protein product [Paramecium primaurelia]|uniref:Uncharacterized protein n=1 Tax=Paramecium primaurelia TaxID=5886 RepID=A0A8S1QDN5_PARPR|nr:unnamed protein product [Paramecium primaurelia]